MKPIHRRTLFTSIVIGLIGNLSPHSIAGADETQVAFVDLTEVANRNRSEDQHGFDGNNLMELKSGIRELAGVRFQIFDKFLSLGSKVEKRFPVKIEGIKVDQTAKRIQFLQGTGYGAYGEAGDALFVADGTPVGEYVVHYADKSAEKVSIVYGQDVRDWWNWEKPFEVTRGKVAWSGENLFSRQQGQKIRLYLGTWENPKPDVKIAKIDYLSTATTAAAPFCLAITLEKK